MDPFVGEIKLVPYNFAPTGWALCAGQLMPISQNTALFSLLGTMYGGNGISTFALPDLRGRVALGIGQGPGLSLYDQGEVGGDEIVTLLASEMPAHTHGVNVTSTVATADNPVGKHAAATPASTGNAYGTGVTGQMPVGAIGSTGGGQPHSNMQPYLALNYIIALQGVFPQRP